MLEWIRHHLIDPLMPDVDVRTDDDLYLWTQAQHEALQQRIETERAIILRRAREHPNGQTEDDHADH